MNKNCNKTAASHVVWIIIVIILVLIVLVIFGGKLFHISKIFGHRMTECEKQGGVCVPPEYCPPGAVMDAQCPSSDKNDTTKKICCLKMAIEKNE